MKNSYKMFLLAAAAWMPELAVAQTGGQAPQAGGGMDNSDIIVTARRREETLQDVPISITAVSGEALARSGVSDALALQTRVPSLSITNQGTSRNELGFAIRGQRTQESQLLTDPPVGTYFAEVVQARSIGFANALYDLQSTQVLKGVQGTLFGRNMTGGAVLLEPNRPSDRIEAEVRGQVGNFDLRDIYGMINLPVTDRLAIRVAGKHREREGFTKDILTGRDYDDQNFDTFRVSVKWNPVDEIESNTIFDWIKTNEHGTALVATAINPAAPAIAGYGVLRGFGFPTSNPVQAFAAQQSYGKYRFASGMGQGGQFDAYGQQPYERLKNWGISNRTTFDLDFMKVKNIFGYRHLKYDQLMDLDGSSSALIHSNRFRDIQQISEELQGTGTTLNGKLDYVLGTFYFLERGNDGSTSSQFPELSIYGAAAAGALPITTPASFFKNAYLGRGRAETFAVYGAGTYSITDQIKLSAGLRYTIDKRNARVLTYYPNQPTPNTGTCFFRFANGTVPASLANCEQSNSKKWDAVTWDVTLQYQPTKDLTAYISTRKGFRSGGFSLRAASTGNSSHSSRRLCRNMKSA